MGNPTCESCETISKVKPWVFIGFGICVSWRRLEYIVSTRYIGMLQALQKLHASTNGNLESQQRHMHKNDYQKNQPTT